MAKILILSSSPQRDKLIDILLAEQLKARGNDVHIRPLPREAHKAILEIQPNVIVAPPIQQQFAWELMDVAGKFGIGIVLRHVEPGCDIEDLQAMPEYWRKCLLILRPDCVKLEMFWNQAEAQFVKSHGIKTPVAVVGAFVADVYKDKKLAKKLCTKTQLFDKHNLDAGKKLLLISSPWGLVDQGPDNLEHSSKLCQQDVEAKNGWCAMVNEVSARLKENWNILATLHPKIDIEFYKKALGPIPIDISSAATELLFHSDALIHAGSTMAVEMHWLNKPAFQFGDVNSLDLPDGNWWQRRGCSISRVSPYYIEVGKLIEAIQNVTDGANIASNADGMAIKELEDGRYGVMDGRATERAAGLINEIEGQFKLFWPPSTLDYDQLFLFKNPSRMLVKIKCDVCEEIFYAIDPAWFESFKNFYKIKIEYPQDKSCPFCATTIARIYGIEQPARRLTPKEWVA